MKILQLLASPHMGGAERMSFWLSRELKNRGHSPQLYVFRPGNVSEEFIKNGIATTIAESKSGPNENKSAFRRECASGLREVISDFQPDIIHSHVPVANLISSRVIGKTDPPWIATIHGSWRQFGYGPETVGRPHIRPYKWLRHAAGDYLTTRTAKAIIAPAESVKQDLILVGVPAKKIHVILNGTPQLAHNVVSRSIARTKLGLDAGDVVIGALGYFAPVKGFDILIRAFAQIAGKFPRVKLIIAGGDVMGHGAARQEIEKLISRLQLTETVKLIGPVVPGEAFLPSLDIFVISSRTEGLPLALIEAMQHGLPSIVSSAGGSCEAARADHEALVFHSGDGVDLSRKLERLISDQTLRAALGQSAAARASTVLTLEHCVNEYEELFNSMIQSP